jgi:hypothetical protein
MFVRDVYPFFYSVYNQLVKRHGELRTFGEFLSRGLDWHDVALRLILNLFPKDQLNVIHYDTNVDRVAAAFFTSTGLDAATLSGLPARLRVNRSLSATELEILLLSNQLLGERYSSKLSDMMIYHRPDIEHSVAIDNNLITWLERRYEAEVKWVNEEFFRARNVVGIIGGYANRDATETETQDTYRPEIEALAWAFREVADLSRKLKSDARVRVRGLIKEIEDLCEDRSLSVAPGVPEDFDPVMYFICNPDLIEAGVNAYQHFLDWGRKEGRRWRLGA